MGDEPPSSLYIFFAVGARRLDINFAKGYLRKVGKFNISENKVIQKLRIYKINDGNFTEYNF